MSSEVNISDPAIRAELDKLNKLDGGVPFRASPQHAHHTWARTFHSSPELYIQPESLEEVEKAITLARRCRKRITTVGCGHSPSDMTCTSSWMMNLDKYSKILDVHKEKGLVTMQAGIRLYQLGAELDKLGLAMPNLGSINDQSIAGAISTGTHGSTLRHSILSSSVTSLKITLANSRTLSCSPDENEELFRAALCSLGALGVVTEITFQAVPAFTLHWSQTVYPDTHMLNNWNKDLWTQAEFVRVWWFPYTRRSTVWKASKTDDSPERMPYRPSYYDSKLGYKIYHNLLWLSHYVPRILPWVEWFVFGMQYGFGTGPKTTVEAIQPSREALLMNCLYSQYVNEWAIPLKDGPMALRRLSSWLNRLKPSDPDYVDHGIPFDNKGVWVHAPVEIRVSDTTIALKNNDGTPRKSLRPYLDSTCRDGPTLYLNATLYRPYNMDPPCRARYYRAFEYLMREYNGKPHWAKNFHTTGEEFEKMYAEDLQEFRRIRNEADPEGLFTGPWHRRYLLGDQQPRLELEEVESSRKPLPTGGVEIFGSLSVTSETVDDAEHVYKPVFDEAKKNAGQEREAAEKQAEEQAKQARLAAVRKALEEAEAQAAKLQKIEDDRRAIVLEEEKARKLEQHLADKKAADELKKREADEAAHQTQELKKKQDQEAAAKAQAEKEAEELRQKQEADAKKAADEFKEQQRIKREADELAAKQAKELELKKQPEQESAAKAQAANYAEELRLKQEADAKKAELEKQERIKREADELAAKEAKELELKKQQEEEAKAGSERQKKIEDERRAAEAEAKRAAEEKAEQSRLAEVERQREEAERLARIEAEKPEQSRLAELERKKKEEEEGKKMQEAEAKKKQEEEAAVELERKTKEEETKKREAEKTAAAAEAARLQKVESDRLTEVERKKKEESDRLAAIAKREEDEKRAAMQAKKDEELRQAEIARKEKEARLAKEAEAARLEQQRVLEERRVAEEKRKAEERAEKARLMAERQKQAEIERQATIEKRKKEEEENAKLAAAEAQRLREEAKARAALRQQQLDEARAAREREEHEKRMVAEHDRRENAKREALLREKEEKDRLARVAHDNAMRLEAGRKAREAKEREERLERERLAEDARQIEKKRQMEEKRRQIAEKKEAQRIALAKKLVERKEAQAAKKAIEDAAAKKAQEERAIQDRIEAEAKKKKAEEVRKVFMAQVAARAAEAKERESQAKPRRSLSPKNNGAASPTPNSNERKEPSTSQSNGKSENSKPQAPSSPTADQDKETPTSPKSPRSPRAAKIFRPTIGTPTPSVLLAKREGLEQSASARAQKRIKIEEEAEEPILPVRVSSGVWKPQSRPNSLDELLAQQESEREAEN